jgi:hypothetical protein
VRGLPDALNWKVLLTSKATSEPSATERALHLITSIKGEDATSRLHQVAVKYLIDGESDAAKPGGSVGQEFLRVIREGLPE